MNPEFLQAWSTALSDDKKSEQVHFKFTDYVNFIKK